MKLAYKILLVLLSELDLIKLNAEKLFPVLDEVQGRINKDNLLAHLLQLVEEMVLLVLIESGAKGGLHFLPHNIQSGSAVLLGAMGVHLNCSLIYTTCTFRIWYASVFSFILEPFLRANRTDVSTTFLWINFIACKSFYRECPIKIVLASIILPRSWCRL
jgi:hypothetical protein